MNNDRFEATYLLETPLAVEQAAEAMAGEQSSGTFVAVPGETEALKAQCAARVEAVELLEPVDVPSLPGARQQTGPFHRARVRISWPVDNVGRNLPTLLATVQGNLYELAQLSGLKLLDLEFPDRFVDHYRGPQFGIEGTRRLAGVEGRPLIGTIIKPSIGLSPAATAELVETLLAADIDFIKDDELMANPPHSPLAERVPAVMRVIRDHAERSGKKAMYAFNISDEVDAMLRHLELVLEHEGTCIMASLNSVGVAGIKKLADESRLPIHGHRNGWGMLNRFPLLGIDLRAYQKIWRLAGIDHLHVNGLQNKFWEPDDSVVASIEACLKPLGGGRQAMPVVSSGQWGGQAFETYRRTETVDLLYLAGGGIMAHPHGPAEGVRAIKDAWQAATHGISQQQAVQDSPALRASFDFFGKSK